MITKKQDWNGVVLLKNNIEQLGDLESLIWICHRSVIDHAIELTGSNGKTYKVEPEENGYKITCIYSEKLRKRLAVSFGVGVFMMLIAIKIIFEVVLWAN